ncbi:MAG: hypothetical protein HYW25_06130 [Candidatus Aenigmarchaeota archaeon]|nr:hypothetical protein [Candidatus Aenigmarchaeota archaeon]
MNAKLIVALIVAISLSTPAFADVNYAAWLDPSSQTLEWSQSTTINVKIRNDNGFWGAKCYAKSPSSDWSSERKISPGNVGTFSFSLTAPSYGESTNVVTFTVKCNDDYDSDYVYRYLDFTYSYPTPAQKSAYNAINGAQNSIWSAESSKSSAEIAVTNAGISCSQAQSAWNSGNTFLSDANLKFNSATNAYTNRNYASAQTDANAASSSALQAKSKFDEAKTTAENCIAGEQAKQAALEAQRQSALDARNKLLSAISSANNAKLNAESSVTQVSTSCPQSQSAWTEGNSLLNDAKLKDTSSYSKYNSGDYAGAQSDANAGESLANQARSKFESAKQAASACSTQMQQSQQSAQNLINSAEIKLNEAKSSIDSSETVVKGSAECVAMTEAEVKLNSAKESLKNAESSLIAAKSDLTSKNYQTASSNAAKAETLSIQAKNDAESAKLIAQKILSDAGEAQKILSAASEKISEAEKLSSLAKRIEGTSKDGESLVLSAKDAFTLAASSCRAGDQSSTASNSELAKSKAEQAMPYFEKVIEERLAVIAEEIQQNISMMEETRKNYGINVSTDTTKGSVAESLELLESGDYENAIIKMETAKAQTSTIGSQLTNAVEDAKKSQLTGMITAGGGAGLIALAAGGSYLAYRKFRSPRKPRKGGLSCRACGVHLSHDMKFCSSCGAKIKK